MKSVRNRCLLAILALLASPVALAGQPAIIVTWAGSSAPIPTLGFWGMAALALLLAVVGIRLLKNHSAALRVMSVSFIASGLLLGAQAARTGITLDLPDITGGACAGGSESYPVDNAVSLQNECSNPVQIVSYQYPGRIPGCAVLQDVCPVGTVLQPGAACDPVNYYDFDPCRDN